MSDQWPILEGVVTTRDEGGGMHVAPMGPRVSPDWSRLLLRPFPDSTTCRNLLRERQGVLHVTDDVGLIARAALGGLTEPPPHRPAAKVNGFILTDACRHYEFAVRDVDDSADRVHITAEVVGSGRSRDFFGFNRAKHAVLEGAILATRIHILDPETVRAEFERLAVIVGKTAGPGEAAAWESLDHAVRRRLANGGDS